MNLKTYPFEKSTVGSTGISSRLLAAALALGGITSAQAAEATYRYFRFATTAIRNNGSAIQISEFTFSYQGNLLNLNNRDKSGVNVINVQASSGTQDPAGGEAPPKLVDGEVNTKWFRGDALSPANALILDFGDGNSATIDSYNFATANDSAEYGNRTPISWTLAGSDDGTTWIPLDARTNVAVTNTNFTYQAGFDLPAAVPPTVGYFKNYNTGTAGNSSVVLNGSNPLLAWETQNASGGVTLTGPVGSPVAVDPSVPTGFPVSPPDNSTSTYTLTATGTNSEPVAVTTILRTVAGGPSTYRYVRYSTVLRRGGPAGGMTQLSEFEFYNGDTKVTVVEATNPGGTNSAPDSTSGEKVEKLIDGDTATKWLDGGSKPVIFDFGSEVTFDRYLFVTGNDAPDRDPTRWTLEGSNDSTNWTLIENINFDYPTPTERNFSTLTIPLPGDSLAPSVLQFTADVTDVISGSPVTLTYSVGGATSVTINGNTVPGPSGTLVVNPTEPTTTYTIVAAGNLPGLEATAELTITSYTDPGVDVIAFDDFSTTGDEIRMFGSASLSGDRLRLTPEAQSQLGAAWFYKKLDGTGGFEATFDISLNQAEPRTVTPADGIAFVVHNAPGGASVLGNGENGVATNALNIKFKTFGFNADEASRLEVIAGTTVLASASIYNTPGTVLAGIPAVRNEAGEVIAGNYPYTLGTIASHPPYPVRVVYVPGDLDVYFQGIAIVQNVEVYLDSIGAIDGSGKSYFGFTGRTGGNSQNNDIVNWKVRFGNFTTNPPFGIVKTGYKPSPAPDVQALYDLVWNAQPGFNYNVTFSEDLVEWTPVNQNPIPGVAGQLGYSVGVLSETPREFYRVEEIPAGP